MRLVPRRLPHALALVVSGTSPAWAQTGDLVFTPTNPCRVVDTRFATTPVGPLSPGATRTIFLRDATRDYSPQGGNASGCGVPGLSGPAGALTNEAKAIAVNLVAVSPSGPGHLVAWASNQATPVASVLNFQALSPELNIANGIILPMCDAVDPAPCASGDISVIAGVSGVHLIVDVVGYFRRIPRNGISPEQIADGPGSGLDADTVDGVHASALMSASTDNWVNTTGDIMTGTLKLNPSAGFAWSTGADVDLRGRVMQNTSVFLHSTGFANTAVGLGALGLFPSGAIDGENTAVGNSALMNCTAGYQNVAMGSGALAFNNGNRNVGIGYEAIQGPMGGSALGGNNIAMGFDALKGITSGSGNIGIGDQAGQWITTGGNNIIIGGGYGTPVLSDTIQIGDTQSRFFAAGIRGRTTVNPDAIPVLIDSAGQLGTVSSSIRVKDDVRDMSDQSSALLQLRPVTFRYKGQPSGQHFGLIAEEVNEVLPGLVVRSADGEIETVKYDELPAMLLNELQKQRRKLTAQEELIAELEARLSRLEGK